MSWSLCSKTQPAADLCDGGLVGGACRNVSAARIHSTRPSLNIVSLRVTRYSNYFFTRIAAAALREVDLVAALEEDRFALLLAEAATEEARTSA
mgnify:CR=1 FL=1